VCPPLIIVGLGSPNPLSQTPVEMAKDNIGKSCPDTAYATVNHGTSYTHAHSSVLRFANIVTYLNEKYLNKCLLST